jgi:nucleoside-diphosphate-sugar epimerase
MLNVLVVGASGYIGSSAAEQLFLAGDHEVFALAPTQSAGYRLAAKELIPLVGKITDKDSVLDVVRRGNIDIIVECTSFNDATTKPNIFAAVEAAGREMLEEWKSGGSKRPPKKLGFVTVTGIWAHGSSEDPACTFEPGVDGSIRTNPPDGLVAARESYEDAVLGARDILDVGIIRTPFVFGRGGSAWTRALGPLIQAMSTQPDEIVVPVAPRTIVNFINIIDVGLAIEKLVSRLHLISGTSVVPLFPISSDRFDFQDICHADANLFGCRGTVVLRKSTDPTGKDGSDAFLDKIGRTSEMESAHARTVLGWYPKRPGFVARTNIYANSYLAIQAMAKEAREKAEKSA